MVYQNWNGTPVYFQLAVSASYCIEHQEKHGFAKVQENLNGCPITHNWTNQRMEAIGDWHPLDFLHTFFR